MLNAGLSIMLLGAAASVVVCSFWLVQLFGIIFCVSTSMLVLAATAVGIVVGVWISDAEADEGDDIQLAMKGRSIGKRGVGIKLQLEAGGCVVAVEGGDAQVKLPEVLSMPAVWWKSSHFRHSA